MKCVKKLTMIALSVVFCVFLMGAPVMAKNMKKIEGPGKAKNIIFMVPDGQGLSNVTAARIFKNGPDGPLLFQETLENIGYQRTHSANSTVTDSAAAASAWAVGEKFINGEVSCHSDGEGGCNDLKPTILELAAQMGKATGLVASSQISHATPASFGAHVPNRGQGFEIARQYIEEVGIDVVLGGGVYHADEEQRQYIIDSAIAKGYTFAQNETQMDSAAGAGAKVLGLFEQNGIGKGKTPEMFWVDGSGYPEGEPTLAEMTWAALDILENDKDGLFLVVEGSQIDWANHAWDISFQIAESLAFDASVKVVLEWLNAKADRKNDTLVIIVADHDCAGFGINGPYGTLSDIGDTVEGSFTSGGHTAVDTIIYSQGPGSEKLNAAVDNTDLYYVMEEVLR
ncbi:MAG: alkaline phosphatase [Desulfobacteraceae bacterium]|jgi:alkaline phosphatase